MQFSLRREPAHITLFIGQLLLLFIAARINTRTAWLTSLPLISLLSLLAWRAALIRLRTIRDTPTSKIVSAAQGYVELVGRGAQFSSTPLLSRLRQLPCLWYRYKIEERESTRNGDRWNTISSGDSPDSFVLRDGTSECVVDPEHAEIHTIYHDQWYDGDYRYNEWTLLKNDEIYVLGEFRTRSGSIEFDSNAELIAILSEWKRDMPALRKRFDLNNDGELDMGEWMLARKAAQREVEKKKRAAQAQPDLNLIAQPRDGKLYLISNRTPEELSRRYFYLSWLHVALFLAVLGATGWLLQTPSNFR